MRNSRKDLHKAKLRRDRIRREKHATQTGAPPAQDSGPVPELRHPFAAERALRSVQALMEGQQFGSVDQINARLAELTGGGRLAEIADAWRQDDPKWRAQELAYDALEADDAVEALELVAEALELDPDCVDAQRLMVSLMPASPQNRIQLMREVVDSAERNLGDSFFAEHTGHFWGKISTRPYMRAKLHLGELLAETGKLEEAAVIFERILELNPDDNLGVRHPLVALYLATNQPDRACGVMSRFQDEERILGASAWARVLERWLAGQPAKAEAALAHARQVNRFVEPYIVGALEIPREGPAYYQPGEASEAQVCAKAFSVAWKSHPAFREWVLSGR